MTVHVNGRMSKIMHTPINVDGRRTYVRDVCQLLNTARFDDSCSSCE